jgi:DNA polymerase-4
MGSIQRAVCHLNIIGYKAAVACVKDRELQGRPFVIAGATGGRALIQDLSPEALKQGLAPGMALALAERKVKDLTVLPPDPPAYETMNKELEKIAAVYAPVFENDTNGNMYLDLTGTTGLFGPPADCTSRILQEIFEQTGIRPAAAVSGNKLVCKAASRVIRPVGLIQIQDGTEAAFLAHQDLRLLPGMGPSLLRTAEVTGFREIGELAALSDGETLSLFGKHGPLLRNTALGIDNSPVVSGENETRKIEKRLDFAEDVLDFEVIRGGIMYLAENAGLEMRRHKLGAGGIQLMAIYSDCKTAYGKAGEKRLLVTDRELGEAALRVFLQVVDRRIRIRSIRFILDDLKPLGWEPDLFVPETENRGRRLQEAADKIRGRYGLNALMSGVVLSAANTGKGLISLEAKA